MWRPLSFLILCLVSAIPVQAQEVDYVFRYTPHCESAYTHFLALRNSQGRAALRQSLREDPDNLLAVYISDYDDFFELLFGGDPAELGQRRANLEKRIRMLEKGKDNDPYLRLCKAGVYLHWALIYGRFGENFKAAMTFRRSYLLIRENKRLFPGFSPNNVFYGMEEALAGTIPDEYAWLASLFGMKGNVNGGIARLSSYINEHPSQTTFLRAEAVIAWCYLKFYLQSQKETVWKYINSNQFPVQSNLLHAFIKSNIALNYRRADVALQTLREAGSIPEAAHYPVLDYETGNALFLKLDPACIPYLEKYIRNHRGRLFIKDAWQNLALSWYLQQDRTKADSCRRQILRTGSKLTDADRQAQRFAEGTAWPRRELLQAHLLCDGGYYRQALAILQKVSLSTLAQTADSVEYHFRLGRIYDELDEENQALEFYQSAIRMGRSRKEHFAARSALQMGMIYERYGRTAEAIARFRECLSMRNHDFQASIDQQAKAGLNRLGG